MGKTQRQIPASLTTFLAPLQGVQTLLDEFGGRGVIIGGIAASLLGQPRLTADVDAVILLELDELPNLIQRASALGIEPRIADAQGFARSNRVLLLRHIESGIDIDFSLGLLPFENEMVQRSHPLLIGSLKLRLPTPEDLIILKAVAHRPKDLLDIEAILANQPTLDQGYIRNWVQQFAEALEMPELWQDLQVRMKSSKK